jgi:peptide/nickel transport system ATP-binding protein
MPPPPATPPGLPVLNVSRLGVGFPLPHGIFHAVSDVSFEISPGQTLGLVGESGCGKSMTALAILGLVPPPGHISTGSIHLGGTDTTKLDLDAMTAIRGERVSMIFQEPMTALNPVLTIGAQIAEAWSLHHKCSKAEARDAALDMLERVRIPEPTRRMDAYPHELSGGMRQRALIAMALICKPDLVIADEPTTALDVTIQAQIIDLMLEMQDDFGMAILFISHNLGVISEIADEVMVMYAGRIAEQASADDLFANPHHPYTRALIETVPRLGAPRDRLPTLAGQVPEPGIPIPGCAFADRCPQADDACRASVPDLLDVDPTRAQGHLAACFKAGHAS